MSETIGDAELSVLGAVIATGGDCLDDLVLVGEDFDNPVHGQLFDVMRKMKLAGKPVDMVTLMDANPPRAAFIASLNDYTPFVGSVGHYAEIVQRHGMRRRLSGVAAGLTSINANLSLSEMTDTARELVDKATGTAKAKLRYIRDILPGVILSMEQETQFTPTPWSSLNTAIGGWRPGMFYVIAARPGIGKTVLAGQIATGLSEHGHVAFSSLEMTEDELVSRLISERAMIMVGKVKDAKMTDRDWTLLAEARTRIAALDVAVDDRSSVTTGDIRTFARSVTRQGKLVGIIVDYLQLVTSTTRADRHVQVAEISRQFKMIAKDFGVPVIALSQLNRESEARSDRKPRLSDLRESGGIEADADCVILLRREGEDSDESLILDIAKNRHGVLTEVDLCWEGMFSRAVEW